MAKKSVFSAGALSALEKKASLLKTTKDTVNPFANWKGPDGKFYARLRIIDGRENKKKPGAVDIIYMFTCLAKLPDSTSATAVPDESFSGETMRIWSSTGASAKQTEEQAWERTMQTIQAFDIKTSKFGMRNGLYDHAAAIADMAAALDYLNEKLPAVVIEVAKGYLNIQGVVDEKVVAKFGKPQTEITEDMIGTIPDEGDADELPADELPDEDELRKGADGFSDESLLEMLSAEVASGTIPLPAELDLKKLPRQLIIDIGIAAQLKRPLPDFSAYLPKQTEEEKKDEETAASTVLMSQGPQDSDDEEMPAPSLPDDDEEEGPSAGQSEEEKALLSLQLVVGTEDRKALKNRLRAMGALRPEDRFTTDQTDEFLRQWVIDVFTGVKPRLVAVAPTEVPFS